MTPTQPKMLSQSETQKGEIRDLNQKKINTKKQESIQNSQTVTNDECGLRNPHMLREKPNWGKTLNEFSELNAQTLSTHLGLLEGGSGLRVEAGRGGGHGGGDVAAEGAHEGTDGATLHGAAGSNERDLDGSGLLLQPQLDILVELLDLELDHLDGVAIVLVGGLHHGCSCAAPVLVSSCANPKTLDQDNDAS